MYIKTEIINGELGITIVAKTEDWDKVKYMVVETPEVVYSVTKIGGKKYNKAEWHKIQQGGNREQAQGY